jgi:outer membrane immunogenic protein
MPLKAPPAVAPEFSWTGFYIGGNLGEKWAETKGSVDIPKATGPGGTSPSSVLPLGSITSPTFMGGGQIGYNYQVGHIVVGIESDADAHHWNATRTVAAVPPTLFGPGDSFAVSSGWEASLRGRIGYAWDRALIYLTGGVALTNANTSADFIATRGFPGAIASDSKVLSGNTFGGGLEFAITNNWSLGAEGRFTWYRNSSYSAGTPATVGFPITGPFTFAPATQTLSLNTVEVLGKINYRF